MNNPQAKVEYPHDKRAPKSPDADTGSDTVITSHSKVPLSILYSTVTIAILGAAAYFDIKHDLAELRKHVKADWTIEEQRMWAISVIKGNPTLNVPDPDAIWKTTHQTQ